VPSWPCVEEVHVQPLERVNRTRRALATTIGARAALGGAGAAFFAAAVGVSLSRRGGASGSVPVWIVATLVGAVAAAVLAYSAGRLTVPRVALWIEERVPRLQYALVTAVDALAAQSNTELLERQIDGISWDVDARRAMMRSIRWPATAATIGLLAFLASGRLGTARVTDSDRLAPTATRSDSRDAPAPFAKLSAIVRAPAYAGGAVARFESPASITAIVGSEVTLQAPGTGDGVSADFGGTQVQLQRAADAWSVSLKMSAKPTLVRLSHASGERIVSLEPRIDSVPTVRLVSPARDTVMRVARGTLTLSAEAHDDIGLASAAFEYIVSSGEGESFKFRSGSLGDRRLGARDAALGGSLALDGLALEPGDIVHLRAVARDGNNVSGPGVGSSETRVLRVARAGEYDSIAVEGAPPPEADKSLISQRMLIMLAEALEKRRPRLAREALLSESRGIARDQTRLRRRVGDIIFARLGDNPSGEEHRDPDETPSVAADSADSSKAALLRAASEATGRGSEILDFEGDETPVVAINRPLLEAYNAMWEASRELEQGETGRALPPMRRALAAIQRARQAERIYLRGRSPAVVVDLAHVRLTGKDRGETSVRSPRAPIDAAAARRAERLAMAIELAARSPAAAIDSIVLLRVESLDVAPPLASALGDALESMRAGRDATTLLARARRIAEGSTRASGAVGAWSGVW
jgi:hypothetical protein